MKKILITRILPDKVLDAARAKFDVTVRDDVTPLNVNEAADALQTYDGILPTLGDAFDATCFEQAGKPRCKILANFGVGYNHIDATAAAKAGVFVSNTPGAVTDATADIAMTLLLMTARRASEGERITRAGGWKGWGPVQMLGTHVTGKTVAIIGMGRIGKAIAKRCHYGFDMNVVFYNRSIVQEPGVPAEQMPTLEAALGAADFVVVAVPGSKETHHLIDGNAFRDMKSTGIFINISRGDVVDEPALISALQNKVIHAAGLDVYEQEPFVPEALRALDNVTLLPHLGTAALEVRENMGMMALDNLIAALDGKAPPNKV
ncbi:MULTISPECIES: 2-hydroxyacid dehydrogenase [Halocynthiibacter]|uniref:Glyoxylate/hydroxypyruvate reductase B n=1 Tax=Halocynthiibacter halioticoli TaxID=2986804 RepID=A0AAE3LSN6_9RHOB|nr:MULTISPECIES: D-glycerate dehydrogenase [Halocynthiibacter]MCV6823721.1 D-glycerate dehydrogenase [Halocynthiibacter halioticoli]MCW4056722.1 D-glycerate dehydrogenase [Halocynthiibacter sp. SDUM655004]MDE0590261.1 D-glycerate dehydrogenase [Halocynthiibacter sp. C4]